ncbi:hypothetical protein ACLRDC_19685 [Gluconacetobacter sacchari]|uniref:hypothetical protein n=1 Tax=Gluconacetobacter sacchari TaxID=92759 RepID=UPI0039B5522D
MKINLNGWPGVGKLTVGRILAERIGARFISNHAILDLAEAIANRGTPAFYDAVRAIRTTTFEQLAQLPSDVPVLLTNVVARGGAGFLEETWREIVALACIRGCDLYSVTLECNSDALAGRIAAENRAMFGKIRDPALVSQVKAERTLFDDGATHRLTVDNTALPPEACAERIATWLASVSTTLPS